MSVHFIKQEDVQENEIVLKKWNAGTTFPPSQRAGEYTVGLKAFSDPEVLS